MQVYIPAGLDVDRAKLQQQVVEAVLGGLCRRSFSTYPQHRWLGCDLAVEELGLVKHCHGLLSAAFLDMVTPGARSMQAEAHVDSNFPDLSTPALDRAAASTSGDAVPGAQPTAQPVAAPEVQTGGPDSEVVPPEVLTAAEMAALNDKRRRAATTWLTTKPLPYLQVLRLCLRPMAQLMRTYISRSGDQWEQSQRAQQVALLMKKVEQV